MKGKLNTLVLLILLTQTITACSANSAKTEWKTDCVGRMQITFPDDAEVATTSDKDYELNHVYPAASFSDGQVAPKTSVGIYYLAEIQISPEYAKEQLENKLSLSNKRKEKFSSKKVETTGAEEPFYDLSISSKKVIAWGYGNQQFLEMQIGNHILNSSASNYPEKPSPQLFASYTKIINNIFARQLFDTPIGQGVCLPYMFIKDDGIQPRNIGIAYRLKSHPDIIVWLEDSDAKNYDMTKEEDRRYNKHVEPEEVINSFWAQYENNTRKVYSIWEEPRYYHSVKLAGQKGLATFMQIERYERVKKPYHRPNEEVTDYNAYYQQKAKEEYAEKHPKKHIDYGYFATARGNPKDNTPDLSFYVIQESSHAIAKGIKPLTKDEVLELAETIAASVKQRPVQ